MAEQCDQRWFRQATGQTVDCTYVKNHPLPRHSWESLKAQDEAEAEASAVVRSDDTPDDIRVLLRNIRDGNADPYLEAILAVAHNRKKQLRGARGFNDLMGGL